MKWRYETYFEKKDRLSMWTPWFAWHPVGYNGKAFWLCKIERKMVYAPFIEPYWIYREIEQTQNRKDE